MRQSVLPTAQYFSVGWKIFEKNFPLVLVLVLLIDLPLEVISFFFGPQAYSNIKSQNLGNIVTAVFFVGVSVAVLKNISLTGIVHLANIARNAQGANFLEVLSFALTKWWVVALTGLMSLLIVLVLLVLGIIPGIIMMVYYTFNVHAVVLENKGFWSALSFSKELVKGKWWAVFFGSLMIWVPITVLMGVTSYGSYSLMTGLNIAPYFVPNTLAILIGYYGWIVFTQFYLSLKEKSQSAQEPILAAS